MAVFRFGAYCLVISKLALVLLSFTLMGSGSGTTLVYDSRSLWKCSELLTELVAMSCTLGFVVDT